MGLVRSQTQTLKMLFRF